MTNSSFGRTLSPPWLLPVFRPPSCEKGLLARESPGRQPPPRTGGDPPVSWFLRLLRGGPGVAFSVLLGSLYVPVASSEIPWRSQVHCCEPGSEFFSLGKTPQIQGPASLIRKGVFQPLRLQTLPLDHSLLFWNGY